MKTKQLFLLCTLWLTVSLTALAQEPVATLEHSGTTKVYYGEGSFEQAYSASVNGDQIYLSSGRFTFTNIAKGLKIYGAGTSNRNFIKETVLYRITYNSKNEELHDPMPINKGADSLRLEGLYINQGIYFSPDLINYVKIIRCNVGSVQFSNNFKNNCSIEECIVNSNIDFSKLGNNFLVRNSVIGGFISNINGNALIDGNIFLNKATQTNFTIRDVNYSTIQNNIFVYGQYYGKNTNSTLVNNLFLNYVGEVGGQNNWVTSGSDAFIRRLNDTFSYYDDYHLKNTTTFLGTDGTPVGIYGGLGFKEQGVPSNPQIINKTISPKTDDKGNLQINITVKAQDN